MLQIYPLGLGVGTLVPLHGLWQLINKTDVKHNSYSTQRSLKDLKGGWALLLKLHPPKKYMSFIKNRHFEKGTKLKNAMLHGNEKLLKLESNLKGEIFRKHKN